MISRRATLILISICTINLLLVIGNILFRNDAASTKIVEVDSTVYLPETTGRIVLSDDQNPAWWFGYVHCADVHLVTGEFSSDADTFTPETHYSLKAIRDNAPSGSVYVFAHGCLLSKAVNQDWYHRGGINGLIIGPSNSNTGVTTMPVSPPIGLFNPATGTFTTITGTSPASGGAIGPGPVPQPLSTLHIPMPVER